MRTLKKTLALVLVVALVLSISVIGANAFDDVKNTNDYYEAITVLTGMKVIDGMTDKTFEPDGTLTRAQAAKIIAFVKLGPTNAKLVSGATTQKFSDVPTSHWAAGYIEYCANLKIVEGVGDGKFDPEGKLTTAAFTKMLLVAVGMDGTSFSGDSWALNVATSAISSKIYNEKIGVSATTPITRAQACELAFLALGYSKNGDTTVYTVKDSKGNVLYSGSDAITALLMKQADATNVLTASTTSTGSLGNTVFGLTKGTASDDFGRVSTVYTNGKTGTDKVTYGSFAPTALKSYTTAVTTGKIISDLGYSKVSDKVTLSVSVDGGAVTKYTDKNRTDTTPVGGQGTLTEVYKTGTDAYSVIVINTYVATLDGTTNKIVAAKAATSSTDATAAYITIGSMSYETSAFVKGDVVLYTVAGTTIENVVKAASFSGYVTATAAAAGYFRVDGTQYVLSAKSALVIGTAPLAISSTQIRTFYTDTYGNVIYAKDGEAAKIDTSYIYVLAAKSKAAASTSGSDLFSTSTTPAAAQAQVIDVKTGTVSIKNIGIVKGTDGKYYYATATGAASSTEVTDTNAASTYTAGIYEYATLTDGSVVLVKAATTQNFTVQKNVATIGVTGDFVNSATTLTLVEYTTTSGVTTATVTTTTGIANFPTTAKTYNGVVTAASNGLVSNLLVVQAKAPVVASANYAIYKGVGETDATGTKVAFYVNGATVEYYSADLTSLALTAGDVVTVKLTDGKIALATDVVKASPATGLNGLTVTAVESTFVVATDSSKATHVIYFATTYGVADAGNSYAVGTLAVGDVIDVYGTAAAAEFFVIAK